MTSQYLEKPEKYNEMTKMMETVLKMLIDNSRESAVYEITEGLNDNSPKSSIRTEIALHYLLNGKKNEALELVKNIDNDIERDDSISKLSERIALMADHEEAKGIIDEISQSWLKKDTISQISVKFAERRDYKNAMFYAAMSGDLMTQSLLLCKIALSARRDGNIQDYENIFGRALDIVRNFTDEKSKSRALSEISSNLLKHNLFDRALEISETVSDLFEKFQIFVILEKHLFENGYREKASEFLNHIYGLLDSMENDEEKSEAFISLVPTLVKRGKQDSAEKICSEILDDDKKSRLLALIAIEKIKNNNEKDFARILVKAFETIDKIQNKERRRKALEDIFLMCFLENSFEGLKCFLKTFYMTPEMREDSVKALHRTMLCSPLENRRDSLSLLDLYYGTYPILAAKYCILSLIGEGSLNLATEIIENLPK
ncbi:hypothetical protein JXA84_00005, partial [candidate division WOR-3 bacterium]|nr:hypothetical protein [candidate division WOR-3 bacterium]